MTHSDAATSPSPLRSTPLGKTGPSVFPIGLGCMAMSGVHAPAEEAESVATIRHAKQLRPFDGDVARAARFAMTLTAVRLGLLRGPEAPSIAQLLDASLWQRVLPA